VSCDAWRHAVTLCVCLPSWLYHVSTALVSAAKVMCCIQFSLVVVVVVIVVVIVVVVVVAAAAAVSDLLL